MPRAWIGIGNRGELVVWDTEHADGLPVDMNGSLLRQIKAAAKTYDKFQRVLGRMYTEAHQHPNTVRRVR